jgi:hypothetical protein
MGPFDDVADEASTPEGRERVLRLVFGPEVGGDDGGDGGGDPAGDRSPTDGAPPDGRSAAEAELPAP